MSGSNKPAMKRIGYFGEAGYTTIGDEYKMKKSEDMDRYKGNQFQTNPSFKQKFNLGNGLFAKAPPLYNGETYTTLEAYQRKQRNQESKKQIVDIPFKPSNPAKKQLGNLGSNYGTVGYTDRKTPEFPIGGKLTYVAHGTERKKQRSEIVNEPYNIVTNPAKKGGFGYVNYTIGVPKEAGARRAWKGFVGEYAYMDDPYDSAKIAEKEYKKKLAKNVSEVPFRPANPPKLGGPGMWGGNRAIADHPKDCGGALSKFFEYIPTAQDKKKTKQDVAAAHPKDPYDRAAFRLANPPKKGGPGYWGCGKKAGGCGTLNHFPEAVTDPYDTLRMKVLEDKKMQRETLGALAERPPFNSQSYGRSKCTPSIFTMNIKI